MNAIRSRLLLALTLAAATGCAGSGRPGSAPVPVTRQWPVTIEEHIDLWLHGYALLTRDVSQVPVFRRGYRDTLDAVRAEQHVLTGLDANHAQLATLMARNPEIANGQFLPLYFDSWDTLTTAIDAFVRAGGVPPREPAARQQYALLNSFFPTAQSREWLRLFTQAEASESSQFYHAYWMAQETSRRGVVTAVDSLFDAVRPRLRRFLTSTRQTGGKLVLSLVLGGEGRTLNASPDHNVVVVTMPRSPADAAQAIYGFAHEIVQSIATSAVNDNMSPAEQRSGAAAALQPIAAVRAGAMLLQQTVPELAEGYMRFYLAQAGVAAPAGNPEAKFIETFDVPSAVTAALMRQIATALGRI